MLTGLVTKCFLSLKSSDYNKKKFHLGIEYPFNAKTTLCKNVSNINVLKPHLGFFKDTSYRIGQITQFLDHFPQKTFGLSNWAPKIQPGLESIFLAWTSIFKNQTLGIWRKKQVIEHNYLLKQIFNS